MAKRRKPEPGELPVELQIDMDDDRVIEAVARFLLHITRHRHERATGSVDARRRPAARKASRKRSRP